MEKEKFSKELAYRLELILRNYLNTGRFEFNISSDDLQVEWRTPIYFTLGFYYSQNEEKGRYIDDFLRHLKGSSINDLLNNPTEWDFQTSQQASEYIESVINELNKLLGS